MTRLIKKEFAYFIALISVVQRHEFSSEEAIISKYFFSLVPSKIFRIACNKTLQKQANSKNVIFLCAWITVIIKLPVLGCRINKTVCTKLTCKIYKRIFQKNIKHD